MKLGTTSGRGFESSFAPYVWGAIIVIALLLWVWIEYDIRKRKREERVEKEPDE